MYIVVAIAIALLAPSALARVRSGRTRALIVALLLLAPIGALAYQALVSETLSLGTLALAVLVALLAAVCCYCISARPARHG